MILVKKKIKKMIYARKKEKKKKYVDVPYEIEEFIYGRIDYVTDCPFGVCGRYTNGINKVGDIGCNTCEWQVSNDCSNKVVKCAYQKEEKKEEKKLFKW